MADGFTDLEEKIMAILVKERKTAAHTVADAHEIAGLLELQVSELQNIAGISRWALAAGIDYDRAEKEWNAGTQQSRDIYMAGLPGFTEKRIDDRHALDCLCPQCFGPMTLPAQCQSTLEDPEGKRIPLQCSKSGGHDGLHEAAGTRWVAQKR